MKQFSFLLLAGLVGCGGGSLLERSCRGETLATPSCLPYEYSIVREASITPSELQIGDPGSNALLTIVLGTCGTRAPQPHRVRLVARTQNPTSLSDAGSSTSLIDLNTEVRDDGEDGDAAANDGVIITEVINPFFADIPAETDLFVRFEPKAPVDCSSGTCVGGSCIGETLEVPYRTGESFRP